MQKVNSAMKQQEQHAGHLSEEEHLKSRIKWQEQYRNDLLKMKEEEHEAEGGLSNGRRKWFNQEIENAESTISDLEEQLEVVQNE